MAVSEWCLTNVYGPVEGERHAEARRSGREDAVSLAGYDEDE